MSAARVRAVAAVGVERVGDPPRRRGDLPVDFREARAKLGDTRVAERDGRRRLGEFDPERALLVEEPPDRRIVEHRGDARHGRHCRGSARIAAASLSATAGCVAVCLEVRFERGAFRLGERRRQRGDVVAERGRPRLGLRQRRPESLDLGLEARRRPVVTDRRRPR